MHISPVSTNVGLIAIGHSEKIDCDGNYGGSYQWKGHDLSIMLPPGCADETVTVTLDAYLPSSTQDHSLLSAVFDVTTSIEKFKKPVTVHIPHCANITSEEDKERLRFLVVHKDSHEYKKGYFEIGKSFGSVELDNFSFLTIVDMFLSSFLDPLSSFNTSGLAESQAVTDVNLKKRHAIGASVKKISKRYMDILILPKSHNEMSDNWNGKYCVIQDISTCWQVNIVIY